MMPQRRKRQALAFAAFMFVTPNALAQSELIHDTSASGIEQQGTFLSDLALGTCLQLYEAKLPKSWCFVARRERDSVTLTVGSSGPRTTKSPLGFTGGTFRLPLDSISASSEELKPGLTLVVTRFSAEVPTFGSFSIAVSASGHHEFGPYDPNLLCTSCPLRYFIPRCQSTAQGVTVLATSVIDGERVVSPSAWGPSDIIFPGSCRTYWTINSLNMIV